MEPHGHGATHSMSERRALVVIEATAGASTTAPGPLQDLAGRPVLQFLAQRLEPLARTDETTVVVACSDLPVDDAVVDLAARLDLPTIRGRAGDVVGQLAIAFVRHPATELVHLRGDHPLHDPYVIRAAIDLHRTADADLTTNLLPRTYPRGLDVSVLSARALSAAELEISTPAERATAARHVARRPDRFRLASLSSGIDASGERWTASTSSDLATLRALVGQVPDATSASWSRVLSVVGRSDKARPGELRLTAEAPPDPGACPWVRRWTASVDGAKVGEVSVSVGVGGRIERTVAVGEPWTEPARAALYRLLLDDLQAGR